MHHKVKPNPAIFVQNAITDFTFSNKNENIWIENSYIGKKWKLGSCQVITCVPPNNWDISLPDNICIDVVPIAQKEFAARPYGFFDMFKGNVSNEKTIDRKDSALIGVYEQSVRAQYVPYVYPQENGNKTDVRWMTVDNALGKKSVGLLVVGEAPFQMSAHYFTPEDLTRATHIGELFSRDEVTLCIDHLHTGLGGNSCGPGTLEQYRVHPEEVRFGLRLVPVFGGTRAAVERAKDVLPTL